MMDREEEEAARRWAAAERVAAGLPPETGPSRNRRRAWTVIVLAVLIGVALSFAVALLAAKQLLKSAVITPPACAALANSSAQIPDGATYAAGETLSAADKSLTVITALAVKDPAVLADQTKKSADALGSCSTFTIQEGGQKVTTQAQPLPEKTSGDQSTGVLITQVLPSGQKQTTLTVTGVKGNLGATAIKTGTTVTADSAAELVKLVNAVLG